VRKFRFLISVFLAVIGFGSFCYAGSGYHDEPAETIYKIHDILIANNICQVTKVSPQGYKYNNCGEKDLVFGARTTEGFRIYTYAVTDKKVLQQIVLLLKSRYVQYGEKITIEFVATKITWKEEYNRGLFRKLWSSFFGNDENELIVFEQFKRKEK